MELNELKTLWQSTHDQLDRIERNQDILLRRERVRLGRKATWPLWIEPTLSTSMAVVFLWLAGSFLGRQGLNGNAWPAIVVAITALAAILMASRQFQLIPKVDFEEPVLTAQRALLELRQLNIRSTRWMFLAMLPLWIAHPIFILQLLGATNLPSQLPQHLLVGSLTSGTGLSVLLIGLAKGSGRNSKFFRWVDDVFAGEALARAHRLLAQAEEFSTETR